MATTADSSPSHQLSPRGGVGDGRPNSPISRRRSLPNAWAQVVRGEPESPSPLLVTSPAVVGPVSAAPCSPTSSPPVAAASASVAAPEQAAGSSTSASSTDCSASTTPMPSGGSGGSSNVHAGSSVENNGNVAIPRRPAWNKPVNGVIEPVTVMSDAVSWPALSESTRPSPRSLTDLPRPTSDGSTSAPQGSLVNQSPQRQANANANANTTNANHAMPNRQRSMRHRGGNNNSNAGGGSGQGGFKRPPPPPPPMPPPFPVFEMAFGNVLPPPVVMDPSVRAPRSMGGVGPQSHAPNDHSPQRNSSRRGNFGGRPRGDGSYHNNHGGRRDQDYRDVHVPQFVPPPPAFIPPPPPGTPPYGPVPVRPFHGPMGFDMAASPFIYVPTLPPDSFRGVPLVPQGPQSPMFYPPVMEPHLPATIVNQIEYYFSDDNLVKDNFLRNNMDEEGWVPISLIAKFPRVAQLTPSTQLILESLRASSVVELQVDKVRRRDDWAKWIRTSARSSSDSALHTADASVDNVLATSMQTVTLDETTSSSSTSDASNAQTDEDPNKLSAGELTSQSTLANSDGKAANESSS